MKRTVGLSTFWLKWIAILSMTVDHIGALLFPFAVWMRILGRIAMPLFAFCVAEGYRHTRDTKKYILRMLLFAILSIPPYFLTFHIPFNVLFSLLSGLLALEGIHRFSERWQKVLWVVLLSLIVTVTLTDWYFVGTLMIIGFYYANRRPRETALTVLFGMLLNLCGFAFSAWVTGDPAMFFGNRIQVFMLLSIPFLLCYNGKKGPSLKYFFYLFYPLHLLIIWAVAQFLK